MSVGTRRGFLLGLPAAALLASAAAAQDVPAVAGAADLKFALEEIATRFRAEMRREVKLVFGSSGNFTRQIEQGAPFQLFMSADEGFIHRLAGKGLTVDRGALYAVGRVALFAPHGSPLRVDGSLAGLRAALDQGRIKRFSIANPEHAPYGRAAEEALRHSGLWDRVQPMLVFGENAVQATQFAAMGSAQGGIVPYSMSLAPEVAKQGRYALIPAEWHKPLNQRMVLLKGAGDTSRVFYDFLQTKPAREVFIRYGFTLPGESS